MPTFSVPRWIAGLAGKVMSGAWLPWGEAPLNHHPLKSSFRTSLWLCESASFAYKPTASK